MINKGGRPKKEIDVKIFEQLCAMHCTQKEIAELFECNVDTVNAWCKRVYGKGFKDVYRQKSAKGNIALRRILWKHSETNARVAIYLGKKYLDQGDKKEKLIETDLTWFKEEKE